MKRYLEKINNIIKKQGKYNLILIVFIICILVITSLYQTFSLYSESEGVTTVNGLDTYSFILGDNSYINSTTISPGSSKYIDMTISNSSDTPLKYSLYYSTFDTNNIIIGYKENTKDLPSGTILEKDKKYVTIKISNYSNVDANVDFGVKFGFINGGELILDEYEFFIDKFPFLLSEAKSGSYVNYVGNNGCEENSCKGINANYIDSNFKGYCSNPNYQFKTDGFRIAYQEEGSAHLISAGAAECLTGDDPNIEADLDYSSTYDFLDDLNRKALKYCNRDYIKDGICDENTVWSYNGQDFEKILGKGFTLGNCYGIDSTIKTACDYSNDLINNGGYYWINSILKNTDLVFTWNPESTKISTDDLSENLGLRVVLKLDPTIEIISGDGTYNNPYIIFN